MTLNLIRMDECSLHQTLLLCRNSIYSAINTCQVQSWVCRIQSYIFRLIVSFTSLSKLQRTLTHIVSFYMSRSKPLIFPTISKLWIVSRHISTFTKVNMVMGIQKSCYMYLPCPMYLLYPFNQQLHLILYLSNHQIQCLPVTTEMMINGKSSLCSILQ